MQMDAYHYEMKVDQQNYSGRKVKEYAAKVHGKFERRPATSIIERGVSTLIGKKIINYKNFGDFGGSGAGMAGFLLDPPGKEWMVMTIYDTAMNNMLLDGKWVETMYTTINFFKPDHSPWKIYGVNSRIDKDEFTPLICGAVIKDVKLTNSAFTLTLEKNGELHSLEVLDMDKRLSPYPGPYYDKKKIEYAKVLRPGEKMGDYIIFMEDGGDILLY